MSDPGFVLMVLEEPIAITTPLEVQLSEKVHLLSMNEGKLKVPSCGASSEFSMRTSGDNIPKKIVLDPVDNELSTIWRGSLKEAECPATPKGCPSCEKMNNADLEDLICFSDRGELFIDSLCDVKRVKYDFVISNEN